MYPSVSANVPRCTAKPIASVGGADVLDQKKWYAIYTSPRHEKTCARHLQQAGVNAFLPIYTQEKRWKNRQRVKVQLPLFPSYLFVQIENRERSKVLGAPGVLRVLGNSKGPLPVADAAIELMRAETFQGRLEPHPDVAVGQRVRIRSGMMQGVEGVLIRKKNSLWFVLSIELINQRAMVEVDANDIECLAV